ncbi:hypothetical protein P153DRAFT_357729 [Dothidotthia symphoricarpi CBS 119687]|uniref:Uncharacterized protein n=1 Tax=Dothidotthia symphoricarpi CBS 119687 TaxID=1392245 RepID=A0A6A6AAX4_9PLEO|nr:uncharacterized protein P153DRAFT_357729 [Dothidotthia symphoricarpi CBS 119687]KAF2128363.1 hypothetical protein P153DRAFT_357729 [Dothidotthia symphoricarpi CBS 119687]
MSLKHLLNDEDIDSTYSSTRAALSSNDSEVYNDQTWDPYFGQLWGSDTLQGELTQQPNEFDIDPELLKDVQSQIHQWAAGDFLQHHVEEKAPIESRHICYGTIFRVAVRLRGLMAELDNRLKIGTPSPIQGHLQMKLIQFESQFLVTFVDGSTLGEVNVQLQKALTRIIEQRYELDFEVFAPVRAIRETISRTTKAKDAIVRVQINIYGPQVCSQGVGQELSQQKVYLQRPDYIRTGAIYDNPHVLKLADFQLSNVQADWPAEGKITGEYVPETLKETMMDVYSLLTRSQCIKGLEGDKCLRTHLLPHQEKALEFMIQREDGPIPDDFRLWMPTELDGHPCYRHAVTNTTSTLDQPETGGGILADEMGMGKSLSILALTMRTLDAAHKWAIQPDAQVQEISTDWGRRCRSKSTLIVASSDLMINEWFKEIHEHFHPDTMDRLKTIKYHGQDRKDLLTKLHDTDIIITTYHTLASEFSGSKNPLNEIEWFRLVLDEAHIIRRQSTVFYRTVAELTARSRWCLTGTPIQNRLEDIGSLFAFLRVNPFHNISTFRKYVALPFEERGKRRQLAIERFTKLLDSLCLRRTKELLHLPDQQHRIRNVELSPEERVQYDQTKSIMFRAVRNQVGVFDQKSTLGMFQIQLQLRILCNHGTWQQPFSWNRHKLHLLDEREAMEASLGREGEVTCSACRQTMPLLGVGLMYKRYSEHCRHILCLECIEQSMPPGQESLPAHCPLCSPLWATPTQMQPAKHASQEDLYFRSDGQSSKMDALMADVLADVWTSKSIIFTCWTRTIDLVQLYLRKASLGPQNSKRIDGECSTGKRQSILDEFANDPQLRVLVMTTGTGAVGLNLATANRVFIVEPQWNPSVENQAIARALRIGQKQPVLVTRYVVEKTVEQEMRTLQDTKMERANLVKSG